jgi:hypothetical protein
MGLRYSAKPVRLLLGVNGSSIGKMKADGRVNGNHPEGKPRRWACLVDSPSMLPMLPPAWKTN